MDLKTFKLIDLDILAGLYFDILFSATSNTIILHQDTIFPSCLKELKNHILTIYPEWEKNERIIIDVM